MERRTPHGLAKHLHAVHHAGAQQSRHLHTIHALYTGDVQTIQDKARLEAACSAELKMQSFLSTEHAELRFLMRVTTKAVRMTLCLEEPEFEEQFQALAEDYKQSQVSQSEWYKTELNSKTILLIGLLRSLDKESRKNLARALMRGLLEQYQHVEKIKTRLMRRLCIKTAEHMTSS